jgi:hypothetical protein
MPGKQEQPAERGHQAKPDPAFLKLRGRRDDARVARQRKLASDRDRGAINRGDGGFGAVVDALRRALKHRIDLVANGGRLGGRQLLEEGEIGACGEMLSRAGQDQGAHGCILGQCVDGDADFPEAVRAKCVAPVAPVDGDGPDPILDADLDIFERHEFSPQVPWAILAQPSRANEKSCQTLASQALGAAIKQAKAKEGG